MPVIKSNNYNIYIGPTALKSLSAFINKKKYSSVFIIVDENTITHCLPRLITSCIELTTAEIIEIESGEASKSLEITTLILQTFIENKADASSLVINLGGGVTSDIGGFVASIYKRGIDFINVPTSLLAMADASVGGKTGIDFSGIKNVIGTFSQPVAVFIDTVFLETLPERHFKNGLAEIFKIALAYDRTFWEVLKIKALTNTQNIIIKSVNLKNIIVMSDPFDKGLRKILNFGHSIGHSLEALFLAAGKNIFHGECIVAGMIIESHISVQKKMLDKKQFGEICNMLCSVFEPINISDLSTEAILALLTHDKKNLHQKLLFSLPALIGSCRYNIEVRPTQVDKAIQFYNSLRR